MRILLCLFGVHVRSRGQVRTEDPVLTSVCRYCNKPMAKHDGRWQIDAEAERS